MTRSTSLAIVLLLLPSCVLAATPSTGLAFGKAAALSLAPSGPPLYVGEIHVEGAPRDLAQMANAEASKFTGSSYSAEVLIGLLEAELSDMCKEHGYLQAKVHVSPLSDPVVKSNGSYISLMATIEPGPQYKLGAIVLSPGQLVTQADFDRQSTLRKGQVVTPRELRAAWERLKSQYHRRGYMQAQVEAVPSYQSEQNRVNYIVNVVSGQVYTMGSFSVECDDDAIRDSLTKAWKLKPGAVFDESAASTLTNASFESIVGKYRTGYTLRYSLQLNKENRTVDVVVRFEEAPHS